MSIYAGFDDPSYTLADWRRDEARPMPAPAKREVCTRCWQGRACWYVDCPHHDHESPPRSP